MAQSRAESVDDGNAARGAPALQATPYSHLFGIYLTNLALAPAFQVTPLPHLFGIYLANLALAPAIQVTPLSSTLLVYCPSGDPPTLYLVGIYLAIPTLVTNDMYLSTIALYILVF